MDSTAREWIQSQMPALRARLRAALGVDEADDLSALLCRHPARVDVTSTHLDVSFSLVELPIEVRLSGLDRDPGWVPAASRYVAFHFD